MKAVLLLHGFMTDEKDFEPIVPLLQDLYDKVNLIRFPGHGVGVDTKLFTVEGTFSCLLETYDELKKTFDTIDVIGFSMGGALGTYLQRVREVNKLVLLAPANKFLNIRLLPARFVFIAKNIFSALLLKKKKANEHEQVKQKLEALKENDRRAFKIAVEKLLPNYTPRTINTFMRVVKKCNEGLEAITPPTLIIWGHLDQFVPIESVKYDFSLCINENKKLINLEDLSHLMLNSVEIAHLIQEIIDFLR